MTEHHHPIRDAAIHIFERSEYNGQGSRYLARFHPYNAYPVHALGATESEVVAKLETLRTEAIEKHEADVIRRKEAAERMKAKKAAKETS